MKINYIVIVLALVASLLASFVGLKQKVIWAFIGGFIATDLLRSFLGFYFRFGFGAYGFFVSFVVGLLCASLVQSREGS